MAAEYLNYLYSDEAQEIAAENYFRPTNEKILKKHSDTFNLNINLEIIIDYGGWIKCRRNISQMAEFSIRFMRDKGRQDEARA